MCAQRSHESGDPGGFAGRAAHQCQDVIGSEAVPQSDFSIVLDRVAPTGRALQAPQSGESDPAARLFAKSGLLIRRGTSNWLSPTIGAAVSPWRGAFPGNAQAICGSQTADRPEPSTRFERATSGSFTRAATLSASLRASRWSSRRVRQHRPYESEWARPAQGKAPHPRLPADHSRGQPPEELEHHTGAYSNFSEIKSRLAALADAVR